MWIEVEGGIYQMLNFFDVNQWNSQHETVTCFESVHPERVVIDLIGN